MHLFGSTKKSLGGILAPLENIIHELAQFVENNQITISENTETIATLTSENAKLTADIDKADKVTMNIAKILN